MNEQANVPDAAVVAVRSSIEDASNIPNLLAERAVAAILADKMASRALLDTLGHAVGVAPDHYRKLDAQRDRGDPVHAYPCQHCGSFHVGNDVERS